MKRNKKKINSRLLYSLISLGILIFMIGGIFAINPATDAYHNSTSVNFSGGFNVPSGNVGVGTTSPGGLLHISGTAVLLSLENSVTSHRWDFYSGGSVTNDGLGIYDRKNSSYRFALIDNGNIGIGTTAPAYKLQVEGSINADAFLYDSDISLKKNIQPILNPLDKIGKLQGVSFNWKEDGKQSLGLVAQDVEEIFPELVHTDGKGLKSVEYGNLVAVLIEAIKEQQKEIDELKLQLED